MRVAIIRLSALGDIIHAAVINEFLYKSGIKVDWIVEERFREILDHNKYINEIKTVNLKNKKRIFFEINRIRKWEKYDLVIDFQGLIKSAILGKIVGKKVIGCDEYHTKEKPALLFYDKKLKIRNHTIGRYKDMINEVFDLKITNEDIKNHSPYLFYEKKDFIVEDFFSKNKKNIIFIIGSTATNRKYPIKKWIKLANSLNANVLIPYGNEEEKEEALLISENSNAEVLPKMNLNELKACISYADLLIGNDTGPSYIAWANKIPNILLYGATPFGRVFENEYTKIIKSKTSKNLEVIDKNDFSIRDISVREILDAVEKI